MSYASTAVNSVKQATTTTAYAEAVKNLSLKQAQLALSTKNLSAEQQREILITAGLIKETGTLTMAQATEALTTDTRNAADVEALMLKAGLITELGAETTATFTVDAAKLQELVNTKVLTQAEAELLAIKAGVTLQSTKEAAILIASNAKLGSSFAIMGKTVGTALKGIGTKLLSFASAHPLITALIGVASVVGLVTSGTKKLREEQKRAIETARSLHEEYRGSTKSLSDNISSLESQKDEFERLSKGVDDYGKNISLSSDEYDRYKSIIAEILGYSPELIQGYDDEGNAIANKNSLIERSIELMKEEQRQKLKEMTTDEKIKTVYEGAKASWEKTKYYDGAKTRNDIANFFEAHEKSSGFLVESDIINALGLKKEWDAYRSNHLVKNIDSFVIDNIEAVTKAVKDHKQALLDLKDPRGNQVFTFDEIEKIIGKADTWQQQYADWQRDIEDAKHGMDDQFELYAQKADGYNSLTDAQKAFVNEYIKATGDIIDSDGHLLSENEIIEKAEGYTRFVKKLASDPDFEEARTKINTLFSFDKSSIPASEYEKQVNIILEELQDEFNLTDDEVMDFKIALGFTFTSDGKTQVGELLDQVKGKLKDEFDGKADELTIEELQIAAKIVADIPKNTLLSWNELQEKIKETQQAVDETTISLSDLEKASDDIGTLSTAFKELSDDGYITTKTLGEIKTATGLADGEWAKYEQKLLTAKAGSAELNQTLSELTYKMLDAKFGTIDLTNATEEEISAIETKIAATLRERGATNASAVTHDWLTKTKAEEKAVNFELSDSIEDNKNKLVEDAKACGLSTVAYAQLVAQETIFNNNSLDITDKLSKLASLQQALGQTTSVAIGLTNALAGTNIDGRIAMATAIQQYGIKRTAKGYEFNGVTYNSGMDAVNAAMSAEIIKGYKPNFEITDFSGALKDSSKSDKDTFDDSYYSEVEAWLEENEKEVERLKKEFDALNRQFENALETGNTESIKILRQKLAENAKAQKDLLHSQNEANRITQNELLQSLYQYAPSLTGKSWDEISKVEIQRIENALSKAVESAPDDATKNQAQLKLNYFKGIIDDKQSLDDAIQKNSEAWWDADEDIADGWRSAIDARTENSEDWISTQKDLNNLTVEEELAAYKRIIGYHEDYLSQILADESLSKEAREALWAEYYKSQKDYEIEYHKLVVDSIKNSLQQAYDDFEERINKRKEALDFEKEQLSSLSTLLGKYYDVMNSIDEEQYNITKELEASKTMTEYLDEETRKLLFSQEDYNILYEELNRLKEKGNSLQEKYQQDIMNATLENISEITSNYERQYDIMLKQYEIAKAELEVAKKRQQLDNVLAEKNIKMLIDGRWRWVANTQDVINAQSELADAEHNVTKAQSGLNQTTEEHKLQSMINSLETTGNKMDAMLERRKNKLDSILESFEQKPAELSEILAEISASGVTTISEVCGKVSGALGDLYRSLTGKSVNVPSPVSSSGDSNRFTINGTAYNPKTMDLGEDGSITLYYDDNGKLISHGGLNKYASGTKSAAPGLAWIGEGKDGSEFLAKNGHLIPINQPTLANLNGGEMVFNHAQMQNLWKWSDFNPSRLLVKNPQGNIDNSNCNNINIGDLRLDATSGVGKELADVLYRIKNMR